jgi:hypothetical protein
MIFRLKNRYIVIYKKEGKNETENCYKKKKVKQDTLLFDNLLLYVPQHKIDA